MTIVKESGIEINKARMEKHVLFNQAGLFALSYTDPHCDNCTLGFLEFGNSKDQLFDAIDWVNKENYSALISIDEHGSKKQQTNPEHLTENICVSFEGIHGMEYEKIIKSLIEMKQMFDNTIPLSIIWVLEEGLYQDDSLIFMDSKGNFTFINKINGYYDKNIFYLKHARRINPLYPVQHTIAPPFLLPKGSSHANVDGHPYHFDY